MGVLAALHWLILGGWIPAQAAEDGWQAIPGGRTHHLIPSGTGRTGFTLLTSTSTGLTFTNLLPEARSLANQIYLNGSGVAAGDIDGDGRCDLFLAGLGGGSRLFRNLGDWHFVDITASAGLDFTHLDASGVALADVDGDGDLDLLVNSVGGGLRVWRNDGSGHFQPSQPERPLNPGRGGTSISLADLDGDGFLDLYAANYRTNTIRDEPNTQFRFNMVNGKPEVSSVNGRPITDPDLAHRFQFTLRLNPDGTATFRHEENGEPPALFRNDGQGHFVEEAWTGGTFLDEEGRALREPPYDWGLSVLLRDLNGDGFPDIYTCNDFRSPDRLWLNDGRGHFRAAPLLSLRHTSLSAMTADVADVNRDGRDDLFVADMFSPDPVRRLMQQIDLEPEMLKIGQFRNRPQYSRNTLSLARSDGTFAEIAHLAGLEASDWTWGAVFLDVDLDGYEDLLIANGYERDNMNTDALRRMQARRAAKAMTVEEQLGLRREFPRLDTPNLAYRNLGDGRFQETGAAWGFQARGVAQAMCLADLDNDGDLDVVVGQLNGPVLLYRNDSPAPRVAVRLKGKTPNTHGIGARIAVRGASVVQSQEMMCGGRYLSADENLRVFAAGHGAMEIEVRWRQGRVSRIQGVFANQLCEIDEASAQDAAVPAAPSITRWFEDVSLKLGHSHVSEPGDDFVRQPTLPVRLSQTGPGVAWFDWNGDGHDDLVIGAGRTGRLGVFLGDGRGGLALLTNAAISAPLEVDLAGLVGIPAAGETALLLAAASKREEAGSGAGLWFSRSPSSNWTCAYSAEPGTQSGPLAVADVNGDGQLDVFLGSTYRFGRFPEAVSSQLLLGGKEGFRADTNQTAVLRTIGLVQGAVFTDLNGDGWPDLVLSCAWGPVRVLINQKGMFEDATQAWGLDRYLGWWTGVAAGDFDGDGRMDLVAGNLGRNTQYERFRAAPLRLLYGDLRGDGSVEMIEAWTDPAGGKRRPLQPLHHLDKVFPFLRETLGTCEAYARSTVEDIYGDRLRGASERQANTLESMIFFNRGDHFDAVALPLEAQTTAAYAVCVGDADGDGCEDVFLSQNCFAFPADVPRLDAGRGLWLHGDGRGNFSAVDSSVSGVQVWGEQRGAALSDFDEDGRVDLVVSQHGAETCLFQNVGAKPGLRVRLRGPAGNPSAIGAVLRLDYGDHRGPARELHAGSGFWSQDGSVAVLGLAGTPQAVVVRWPGGRETRTVLAPASRTVTISLDGSPSPQSSGR